MTKDKTLLVAGLITMLLARPGFGLAISANDDVTVRGGTVYDEVDAYAGIVWFGLFANGTNDRAYMEFTLGTVPATSATLRLYEYWEGGLIGNPGVDGTTTVKGAVAAFDENDGSAASLDDSTWSELGTFVITLGSEVGLYDVDITSFYNANLGETVTFAIRFQGSGAPGSGDGPIFEDRELTAYTKGISTEAGGAPVVNVDESTLPDCQSRVAPAQAVSSAAIRGYAADPPSFVYSVQNVGAYSLNYTVIESDDQGNQVDHTWLSLNKSGGGPIPSSGSDDVTATISDTDMAGGVYTGYITITDDCDPAHSHTRQINLTIVGCQDEVTPTAGMYRSYVADSVNPVPDVVWTVRNTGQDGLTYTAAEVVECPWLALNKANGGPLNYGQTDDVTAAINPTGLDQGNYTCTVRFTDNCTVVHDREVVLSVLTTRSALQQFEAEFVDFTGTDATAESPLESCNLGIEIPDGREYHATYDSASQTGLTGFLTQGTIGGDPTTAKFWNPAGDGKAGRFRLASYLPWDDSYDPTKGVIVAWRMKVGSYNLIRGPIQLCAPSVTGPFTDNLDTADEFNCYIRLDNGRALYILNNSGVAVGGLNQPLDIGNNGTRNFAGEWHQWTAAAVYDGVDMTYWNLWVDGEKLFFTGANGSVSGPGGGVYSFRTAHDGVTGTPYTGLGDLGNADQWDFEFDWVRMISLDTSECPFWDGQGCVAAPRCNTPFADADGDADVDQSDYSDFQRCFTGPGNTGAFDPESCACYDRDGDEDVDGLDGQKFEACASGPGVPWQPNVECPE